VEIQADNIIDRDEITQTERLIRPHIRRTPIIEVDAADFGLVAARLSFKLELLQHAGSFKTRGAFANLLSRQIPRAGVVAASGGNHGAAVAYASMRLGISAKIFVPRSHHLRRFRESATIGPNWSSQVTAMPMLSRQVKPGQSNQERSRSTPSTSANTFGPGNHRAGDGGAETRYRHASRRCRRRRAYRRYCCSGTAARSG
jgi:cysteine synthase